MDENTLVNKLKESFPEAVVKATDLTGGGDHWHLEIETTEFSGKSMIEQHQMVYKALGDWMKKEIHALSMNTRTPA